MKYILISIFSITLVLNAECNNMPMGTALAKTIKAHKLEESRSLLEEYKKEVATYLKGCNNDKDKFEETSIMIHTYEDRIEDIEHDLNKKAHGTDCNIVPSSKQLEEAFKVKDSALIQKRYAAYKESAKNYIEHCASHAEYETVFESAMFCEEEYNNWKKKEK